MALRFGRYEVAAIIFRQVNIDFSLGRKAGNTVAIFAVLARNVPCVEILAKQVNCWNIPEKDGNTPIMNAIRLDNADILKMLLKCSLVNSNKKDGYGDSPVMKVIKEEKMILILVRRIPLR